MRARLKASAGAAAAMLVAALGFGCGVKSQPIPLEYAVPERIADLRAVSARGGIQLVWGRPERYVGGRKMTGLGRFEVFRAEENGPYRSLAEIPVTDQERFQQQHRFTYLDRAARLGGSYRYEVFSRTLDGYQSAPSNKIEVTRHKLGPAPNPKTFVLPAPVPPR